MRRAPAAVARALPRSLALALVLLASGALAQHVIELLDRSDRAHLNEALEGGSEDDRVAWTNPDSGITFGVTPTRTFEQDGLDCRDFTLDVGDQSDPETACRHDDGMWLIVPRYHKYID